MLDSQAIRVKVMPVIVQDKRIVRFGVFEADLKTGELRRNGSKVRLQEQPFQILTVLLERPGDVVSREELRTRLWPSDTFVDFDHSLNTAVRRLRDALGDSAENPRFVETVARRGYRLLAPVNGNGMGEATSVHRSRISWRFISAFAAIVLVAGAGIAWRARTEGVRPPALPRRLTANPEDDPILRATLSPDGKYLAFADHTGFYLQQVDTGETHAVPLPKPALLRPAMFSLDLHRGTRPVAQPFQSFAPEPASWFPDSTHLVATWVASAEEPVGLWEISVLGGEPRKLSDEGWRPAVSPDGTQIAFLRGSQKGENEIWVMQADGAQPRMVRPADGSYCGTPAWAPDSRHIAFARSVYVPGMWESRTEIDALNLATKKSQVVLSIAGLGPAIAWTPDNRLIFSLDEPPPNQTDSNLFFARIDSHTLQAASPPTRITSQPGGVADVSLSSDGKRLALTRRTLQPDVYVTSLVERGARLTPPKRLTLDERADIPYSWTPDSHSVIFISDRYGPFNIFKQDLDESTPELIVGGKDKLSIARLSPDASQIIYLVQPTLEDASGAVHLMRVPLAGGPSQMILEAPGIMNQQCARLPSTLCLYSQMIRRNEMRIYSFDPNGAGQGREIEKARVVDEGAYSYNWSLSPDGETLAMVKKVGLQRELRIRLLSLSDGSERFLPVPGFSGIGCLDWAADGKTIWAVTYSTTNEKVLLNVDLQDHVRPMLEEKQMILGFAIPSPDGKKLAFWKASGGSNVWLVENF
jgi:Tol biopolymer transport system component/DNA-binding winged helix-turn-helix (wHTH) protein